MTIIGHFEGVPVEVDAPCPICGKQPEYYPTAAGHHGYRCDGLDERHTILVMAQTQEKAAELWQKATKK